MSQDIRKFYPEFAKQLHFRKEEILNQLSLESLHLQESGPMTPGDGVDSSVIDANTEYSMKLANHYRGELDEVKNALDRLGHGTYGICEACDHTIGLERLEKLPEARMCIECQKKDEKLNSHSKT